MKHSLIYQQRPSGMCRLHLHVMHSDRWHSVSTVTTDPKSKKAWSGWRKLKYKGHYRQGYMCFGGVFVTLEACLGRNAISIMSRSLSTLALYKSKNLILDWMADLSCARTSIRGQELHGSKSFSLATNTWALFQDLSLCDADLRCTRTPMISQQTLQLCYKEVSQCLIFWEKYSISPRLSWLPLGLRNML